MTAEEYITQNFGESWLKNDWSSGDVIDALGEYGKYCAEIAFDDGFCPGFIDNHRPSFEEWWANFQRKEAIDDRQLIQPAVNFITMIGKTVKYRDKIYQVTQWIHYRLEWFEVELKDNNGYHKFWLKESDVVVL